MNPEWPNAEGTAGTDQPPAWVLVAGATGYIGRHIVEALHDAGYRVRALVRNVAKLDPVADACDEVVVGDVTDPESLDGVCDGVDVVISALGLRTFRPRPTADEVDFGANLNVLKCAQSAGVGQFIFVGVLDSAQLLAQVPILRPREQFVDELRKSQLTWTVIKPTGAFNDAAEVFRIAQRGWAFMLGDGSHRINPIHPGDIARVAVRAISDTTLHRTEYGIGGPDTYTQRELADLAGQVLGKRLRPLRVPSWPLDAAATVLHPFNRNAAGFLRFFRHTLTRDMVGNPVGDHHLAAFYRELAADQQNSGGFSPENQASSLSRTNVDND